VCLSGSAKGRAVLLRVGRQWQLLEQSLREVQEREAQARLGAVLPGAAAAAPLPPPVVPGTSVLRPRNTVWFAIGWWLVSACSPATVHGRVLLKLAQTSVDSAVRAAKKPSAAAAPLTTVTEPYKGTSSQTLLPACCCSAGPMTQAELQASAEWAAATLEATQCAGGPDPSQAASCAAIAQVLRELGGSSSACASAWQEYEAVVESEAQQQLKPQHTWTRWVVSCSPAAVQQRMCEAPSQGPAGGADSLWGCVLVLSACVDHSGLQRRVGGVLDHAVNVCRTVV
jgi:hypothetical protein